tara:strand:+ start:443 stop:601 length:159 start_codon:yes stop_codon:yes gene_type:complete
MMMDEEKDKKPKLTRAKRKEIRRKKKFIKWSGLNPGTVVDNMYKSYSQTTKK